jgi:DNA-binding CsgD family transcriptional regulator
MLFEDTEVRETLRGVVGRFASDPQLREELFEECLVHLWLKESEKPGRTISWYLQSCRYHLHHWFHLGRSVDSPKRSSAGKRLPIEDTEDSSLLFAFHTDGQLPGTVSFNDLISTTTPYLTERERRVLLGLANGLPLRAIAARSKMSYPTALKCRRRIAEVMKRLEFAGGTNGHSNPLLLPEFASLPAESTKRAFLAEDYG